MPTLHDKCFCGFADDDYTKHGELVPADSCTMVCTGDPTEFCGGWNAISVRQCHAGRRHHVVCSRCERGADVNSTYMCQSVLHSSVYYTNLEVRRVTLRTLSSFYGSAVKCFGSCRKLCAGTNRRYTYRIFCFYLQHEYRTTSYRTTSYRTTSTMDHPPSYMSISILISVQ